MPNDRERDIGVVGSPSTNTELTVDLLQESSEERLVGALVAFEATQSGLPITSVGQIVGVELRNRWHEDSVFRNLIKRTGEIPPITNRQDTRVASLAVGATFKHTDGSHDPDVLGMVPPTGTRVSRLDQALVDDLLAVYQEELFYLGRAYATDVLYPMWFKHFGSGARGAGEAYHIGIFGKTGSGKSGLAKMLLLGYARHSELGVLIVDPAGEFSSELRGQRVGQQGLPLDEVLSRVDRQIEVFPISRIQLDTWALFEELVDTVGFLEQLTTPKGGENARIAAGELVAGFRRGHTRLDSLQDQRVLRDALGILSDRANMIYRADASRARLTGRIQAVLQDTDELSSLYADYWSPLAALFAAADRRRLYGLVQDLVGAFREENRPIYALDVSERGNRDVARFWSDELQKLILKRIFDSLVSAASETLGEVPLANLLVVLDEAHRHAPPGHLDSGSYAELLRTTLIRAVRETRKYGIGWSLISQTLGGIHNEILGQLRILFFGFGLALGDEFRKLGEWAGGDRRAMELYQSFRDPHSAPRPDLREFPFMAVGPVSPLAFSGRPLFFSAFTDSEEFLRANGLDEAQGGQDTRTP